jgi:hypothetical protein
MLDLIGRGERIRTSDLTVPNRALYQAEPRPDRKLIIGYDLVTVKVEVFDLWSLVFCLGSWMFV